MKPKKLLSLLLSLALVVGMIPAFGVTASAAGGNGKAIQLVENFNASNIAGGQESIIYFGNYNQGVVSLSPKTFSVDPIKWRVLENESGNLLLLSDRILDQSEYNSVYKEIAWEKSSIRSWLNGYGPSENDSDQNYTSYCFKKDAFTNAEYETIADTTVVNDGSNNTSDKIFLLSIEEVTKTAYGFSSSHSNDANRIATNTPYVAAGGRLNHPGTRGSDQPDCWWLRSPGSNSNRALFVSPNGSINDTGSEVASISVFVRPALTLDLTKVIFTSAAVDGKKGDKTLTAVDNYSGNEWKLTVKDSAHKNFDASFYKKSGNLVSVDYTGAVIGTDEFISAIIKNSAGAVTYYGRLTDVSSEEGTVFVDVGGKLNTGDKLYVFNEQYNEDKMTDYASGLKEIVIKEEASLPLAFTTQPASGTAKQTDTYTFSYNTNQTPDSIVLQYWIPQLGKWLPNENPVLYGKTSANVSYTAELCEGNESKYRIEAKKGSETVLSNAFTVRWKEDSAVSTNPFVDVSESDYFYEPVLWAVDKSITNGTDATHFSPAATCTRGQVVTFLWRAAGSPKPTSSVNPFTDVKSSDYFYDAVLWAVGKNITNGTSATTFGPNDGCTRGQVVTFLHRFENTPKPSSTTNPFVDVSSSEYYYNPVLWAVGKGITNGTDATHFSPNATCTRGQIVTFLYRDMD